MSGSIGGAVMKIVGLETFLVPPRWLFVKISTDVGIVGWGEGSLESRAETVRAAVMELEDYLLGKDPLAIESHWQVTWKTAFYRSGAVLGTAVAAINLALWDIAGKYRNVPVHELLGGPVREKVRVYSWIGGDEPNEVVDGALAMKEKGFDAVKMNASSCLELIDKPKVIDGIVARASAVREVLGEEFDFALDFHGRFTSAMAMKVIRELEPLRPLFVEEPVLPEYGGVTLARIVENTSIPIACGERLFSRSEFLPVLDAGIAVAQPDVTHCGGISEMLRIAAVAECYDTVLAPHCPIGPIALAGCLQVDFIAQNVLIQEQSRHIHYNREYDLADYLVDGSVFDYQDGYCLRPLGPGLGIIVDEEEVQRAAMAEMKWRHPVWRRRDGSFAEW